MPRLTDDEITQLATPGPVLFTIEIPDGTSGERRVAVVDVPKLNAMAKEIQERRASDLTDDEREVLAKVARCLGDHDFAEWNDAAKNAFHKLLAVKP